VVAEGTRPLFGVCKGEANSTEIPVYAWAGP